MFFFAGCKKYEIAFAESNAVVPLCGVPLTRHLTRLSISEKGGPHAHQGITLMGSTEEEVIS